MRQVSIVYLCLLPLHFPHFPHSTLSLFHFISFNFLSSLFAHINIFSSSSNTNTKKHSFALQGLKTKMEKEKVVVNDNTWSCYAMDQSDPFESTLTSIVSSNGAVADTFMIRELVGRLGNITSSSPLLSGFALNHHINNNTSTTTTHFNNSPQFDDNNANATGEEDSSVSQTGVVNPRKRKSLPRPKSTPKVPSFSSILVLLFILPNPIFSIWGCS